MAKLNFKKVLDKAKSVDYKGIATDITQKAGKAIEETGKAIKDFDVEKAAKSTGETISGMADTIRNTKPEDIKAGLTDMADKGGKALKSYVDNVIQTSKDVKEALKVEKDNSTISLESAMTIIYLLMAVDNTVDKQEIVVFKEIFNETELEPTVYDSITERCNKIIEEAQSDYYLDVIHENILTILKEEQPSDLRINKKLLLWNLLTIAKADGSYSEEEQRMINTVSRTLSIDKAILPEMEMAYDSIMDIDQAKVEDESDYDQLQHRKEVIMNSVYQLIEDKEV